ncbi:MAG: pyridoxal phosphate-dependent aminotransferase [Firmicutes bacterium]|nr:pyridoxal phosphate-dependent aminotransferase [Bacillota bacterium]
MISKDMARQIEGSSAIRAMFEEGAEMIARYGKENVYDFSLGNPNVPAPASINKAVKDIVDSEDPTVLHGYMLNAGYEDVRQTIADHINRLHGTSFGPGNIIMTVGAAGGLNVFLRTIIEPGYLVIDFAPYFGEYNGYTSNYKAELVVVPPDTETFQPNIEELGRLITPKTKAVIINTPNNPTGVVYSAETLEKLASVLEEKQKEYGTDIYLISDEPYRELVYDGVEVPYVTKFYDNTIVGYSYSKSLSLPGERLGYLVIPDEAADSKLLIEAAGVATRILGFVNAPSLMQKTVAACVDEAVDVAVYDKNRTALYEGLTEMGFECIKPQGAFYLFVKSPFEDEKQFCDLAKKYHIIVVPGSAFACPGYVRMAYCVSYETIVNSLPEFKKLMEEIKSMK